MRFIVSTVGTSLLTNLIDNRNPEESPWRKVLRDAANLSEPELTPETQAVLDTLATRAFEKLSENDVAINRRVSAELNGIYGIYGGTLPQNSSDQHSLICSDTAQGRTTGTLIADFLGDQGFTVSVEIPKGLSTQDTDTFTAGIKELLKWLENTVPGRDTGYEVIFNLVGGFKSLQGYMNTFGAFYADAVIYIFEAQTADLIQIPRLPLQIDTAAIETHLTEFAMMAAGSLYPLESLRGVPETLLERIADNGKTVVGLSAWGELIWNRTKADLLATKLLPFPRLTYAPSFEKELSSENDQARVALQETLATVATILERDGGNPQRLSEGGLQFERFKRHASDIYRFRVTRGIRVSCQFEGGVLRLLHYGQHQYIDEVSHAP